MSAFSTNYLVKATFSISSPTISVLSTSKGNVLLSFLWMSTFSTNYLAKATFSISLPSVSVFLQARSRFSKFSINSGDLYKLFNKSLCCHHQIQSLSHRRTSGDASLFLQPTKTYVTYPEQITSKLPGLMRTCWCVPFVYVSRSLPLIATSQGGCLQED